MHELATAERLREQILADMEAEIDAAIARAFTRLAALDRQTLAPDAQLGAGSPVPED